jgi:AraC family transcriptional regulator of adaptative response / DNA-3-methyladenine glycosylase II
MDGWEMAVHALLGQQVTTAGARTLGGRLVQTLGEPLSEPRGTLTHLFPTPEAVAGSELTDIGIIRSRARALRTLARAVIRGDLVLDRGANRTETERLLLEIPGIGPWTATYIAMRALRDPDAFPAADLGLKRAFERCGGDPAGLTQHAERWRPWKGYAAMYLWTSGLKGRET